MVSRRAAKYSSQIENDFKSREIFVISTGYYSRVQTPTGCAGCLVHASILRSVRCGGVTPTHQQCYGRQRGLPQSSSRYRWASFVRRPVTWPLPSKVQGTSQVRADTISGSRAWQWPPRDSRPDVYRVRTAEGNIK